MREKFGNAVVMEAVLVGKQEWKAYEVVEGKVVMQIHRAPLCRHAVKYFVFNQATCTVYTGVPTWMHWVGEQRIAFLACSHVLACLHDPQTRGYRSDAQLKRRIHKVSAMLCCSWGCGPSMWIKSPHQREQQVEYGARWLPEIKRPPVALVPGQVVIKTARTHQDDISAASENVPEHDERDVRNGEDGPSHDEHHRFYQASKSSEHRRKPGREVHHRHQCSNGLARGVEAPSINKGSTRLKQPLKDMDNKALHDGGGADEPPGDVLTEDEVALRQGVPAGDAMASSSAIIWATLIFPPEDMEAKELSRTMVSHSSDKEVGEPVQATNYSSRVATNISTQTTAMGAQKTSAKRIVRIAGKGSLLLPGSNTRKHPLQNCTICGSTTSRPRIQDWQQQKQARGHQHHRREDLVLAYGPQSWDHQESSCYNNHLGVALMTTEVAKNIYLAYYHSIMCYGISFWGYSTGSKKVFHIQKRSVRIINAKKKIQTAIMPIILQMFPYIVPPEIQVEIDKQAHLYEGVCNWLNDIKQSVLRGEDCDQVFRAPKTPAYQKRKQGRTIKPIPEEVGADADDTFNVSSSSIQSSASSVISDISMTRSCRSRTAAMKASLHIKTQVNVSLNTKMRQPSQDLECDVQSNVVTHSSDSFHSCVEPPSKKACLDGSSTVNELSTKCGAKGAGNVLNSEIGVSLPASEMTQVKTNSCKLREISSESELGRNPRGKRTMKSARSTHAHSKALNERSRRVRTQRKEVLKRPNSPVEENSNVHSDDVVEDSLCVNTMVKRARKDTVSRIPCDLAASANDPKLKMKVFVSLMHINISDSTANGLKAVGKTMDIGDTSKNVTTKDVSEGEGNVVMGVNELITKAAVTTDLDVTQTKQNTVETDGVSVTEQRAALTSKVAVIEQESAFVTSQNAVSSDNADVTVTNKDFTSQEEVDISEQQSSKVERKLSRKSGHTKLCNNTEKHCNA
ncbi:hypothetical protein PR048_022950 [Dryococelus australis]|uniref:Uncharacterized protein n=1 Tax=Dryococelus australis TaxID=614101 RepID=A0ABQ9GSQ2_9NEOP|nr:hypothetical protein PR048_022950 [Dryococelus australis]